MGRDRSGLDRSGRVGKTFSTVNENTFELSDVFEDLVDWPKRLAGEEPFFRSLFQRTGARFVLDAACGTGSHLVHLRAWYDVSGFDVSPQMLDIARTKLPQTRLWVSDLDDFSIDAPVDVVACLFGSIVPYFYPLWFGFLLVTRERRDDRWCAKKYGADWDRYRARVPRRIVPWIY